MTNHIIPSPIGHLLIKTNEQDNALIGLSYTNEATDSNPASNFIKKVITELKTYFKNPQHKFSLPIELKGTKHQIKFWQALQNTPVGSTKSYGQFAKELQSSAQAIGTACRKNPIPIIIPCHRVVAKFGLGGYNGAMDGPMLEIKHWLLQHEGVDIDI